MKSLIVTWLCLLLSEGKVILEESQCALDSNSLHCMLRTLQSPIGPKDVNSVEKLDLSCSDNFFLESTLSSDHFGHLPKLTELSIHFCKIRRLPPFAFGGLSNLQHLEVQSHNGDWASVVMDADKDTFQKLSALNSLNLAFNNLYALPPGTFCDLLNLQRLNLSHNHFLALGDTGLQHQPCGPLPELRHLDLSFNHLSSLAKEDLETVAASLEILDLRSNRLQILSDDALSLMPKLRQLHLADNQLAAMPPMIFNSLPSASKLETLELQNNSLTMLTPNLFKGLDRLAMLNVSHNAIAVISADTFAGVPSLRVLDLSYNRLAQMEADLFAKLTTLEILNLSHNQIHTVQGGLPRSLRMISLSHNVISGLQTSHFSSLPALTSLSLDHNKIRYVPDDLLKASPNLEDLSFNSNELRRVPATLTFLTNLRTLDLGENLIDAIEAEDFQTLAKLYGLRLAGNQIKVLQKQHFQNITGIHVLNLAQNQLSDIERGAFDGLRELRALRLDHNFLADINGLVSSLSQLQWLNVSNNKLQWYDYAFVPMSLEWLDIQNNEVEELGNYYKLKSGFHLKRLDASGNLIRHLSKLSLPTSLEMVSLRKNAIRHIENGVFEDKPNLHRVELEDNEINHLELSALSVGRVSPRGQPDFYLAGNPLVCDCGLEWLPEINSPDKHEQYPRVADLSDIKCRLNNQPRNDSIEAVTNVPKSDFLCSYSTHCFSLCMCCEFYACDCRMQCPDGCSCYHDSTWDTNIIQCGLRGHTDVPLLIPMDATVIRLDGNNLTDVDSQSFIGRKRVTALYMNHSQVSTISAQTFNGLANLEVLHLENNNLKALVGHEFQTLLALRELYLQNNELVRIASGAFDNLPMLNYLRLDGNLLTTFPVWTLASTNPFLNSLFLSENMWSCECSFAKPFRTYVHTFADRVVDASQLRCVTANLVSEAFLDTYDMCPEKTRNNVQVSRVDPSVLVASDNLVTILVSVVVAVVVLLAGVCAICCFRHRIKTWLYSKSNEIYESRCSSIASENRVGSQGQQPNKLFDVFIGYCREDEEFVDQSLAPTLEHSSTSYRLCLQQRDFSPQATIYDNVTLATEASTKVLIVLSRAFVLSEWNQLRTVLMHALHGQMNKVVFLMLDFDLKEVKDEELKHYLKVCAVVKWGSPGFLSKLRFFLPEPAIETFQRNVTLRTLSPAIHESPVGSVSTQTTSVYHPSIYSQHTYQSIPEAHIYHTLDPSVEVKVPPHPPVGAVYINKNLELILKPTSLSSSSLDHSSVESPKSSPSKSDILHHMHSASGQQLLPSTNGVDEYVV